MDNDQTNKLKSLKAAVARQVKDMEENKEKYDQQRMDKINNNPSSLLYWYPIVSQIAQIKTPKTHIFPMHFNDQLKMLDSLEISPEAQVTISQMKDVLSQEGKPMFLKNSMFSGKHDWAKTCLVSEPEHLENHLKSITDFAYCVGCEESLHWVLRELIPTTPAFYAFNKMPVTKERRYFISEGKVVFHHPYWLPESINNSSVEDFMPLLDKLNHESDEEIHMLKGLSEKVAHKLPGDWSVDWLQSESGEWYLIDMAETKKSFKWQEYPHGLKGL